MDRQRTRGKPYDVIKLILDNRLLSIMKYYSIPNPITIKKNFMC